jgi:catechol 2,3-dioxygenase-like lactoylglutathione lyase family enzyme
MNITRIMHVNVNCSDYERSRGFYEMLGFKVTWEVPERNTPEVAAAVGMPPYLVRGALL